MIVGYAFVVGDLLHYGHLYFLRECKKHCDYLIVGVFTDELTESYKRHPIIPFEERVELIKELRLVDRIVKVHNRDQTSILKKLTKEGLKISFLFHGTDWTPRTDEDLRKSKEYIESIGGKLVQPEYYRDRTTTSIIQRIIKDKKEVKETDMKTDPYGRYPRDRPTVFGQRVCHSWTELFFIEQILFKHHFDSLIEIGTWEGAVSILFGLHALRMHGKAVTFDTLPEPLDKGLYGKLKPLLPLEFHQLDAFSSEAQKIIKNYINFGRTLLYCDGGDKVREFKLYAPMLKVDDVIMIHDRANALAFEQAYSKEIEGKDIKKIVDSCHLHPLHDDAANQLGGIFIFIKVKE